MRLKKAARSLKIEEALALPQEMISKLHGVSLIPGHHIPPEIPMPHDADVPLGKKYFYFNDEYDNSDDEAL